MMKNHFKQFRMPIKYCISIFYNIFSNYRGKSGERKKMSSLSGLLSYQPIKPIWAKLEVLIGWYNKRPPKEVGFFSFPNLSFTIGASYQKFTDSICNGHLKLITELYLL